MRTFVPRMSVALGAPVAALGTGTAIYHVPAVFWVPIALAGYCLLIAGCRGLAPDWGLAPNRAIVAGLVAGAWTVAGWVGGVFGVLVVAAGQCNEDRSAPQAAWLAGYGLGLVAYLAVSAWVLAAPRRLPAWVLAPVAGLLCVLPVAAYAGICFD